MKLSESDIQILIKEMPKDCTHIVFRKDNSIRYIKLNSKEIETWGNSKIQRQNFSYWSNTERLWIWCGLITFEQYLKNHKGLILHERFYN